VKAGSARAARCAIYTRVSTDQGLGQDFNSLDAQYDAPQAYIRSQTHAGWTLLRAKYEMAASPVAILTAQHSSSSWRMYGPAKSM
jgi:hypothetical protein